MSAMMRTMDEELRRQLGEVRNREAAETDQYLEQARRGLALLRQFVDEMKRLGISPYPMVEYIFTGRPVAEKRRFGRTSSQNERTRSVRLVGHGWTIGHSPSVDSYVPKGLLTGMAITTDYVIVNADWSSGDSGVSVPRGATVRWPEATSPRVEDWLLVSSGEATGKYLGTGYDAKRVAELIHHYTDVLPHISKST